MQFTVKVSAQEFFEITAQEAQEAFEPEKLLYPKEIPVFEKYDEYVPGELIRRGFARGVLDIDGMKERVLGWQPGSQSIFGDRNI